MDKPVNYHKTYSSKDVGNGIVRNVRSCQNGARQTKLRFEMQRGKWHQDDTGMML